MVISNIENGRSIGHDKRWKIPFIVSGFRNLTHWTPQDGCRFSREQSLPEFANCIIALLVGTQT